jgi:Pyruvate/2-oxoacid:ferredoxin oxidoreductase delta subunit
MKRNIITIDEAKCTGCGLCVPNCPEGAIQIIDGKARLVSDLACDGLGACLGHCPEDAITIEEREAAPYDECVVMDTIIKGGPAVIAAHLAHLKDHGQATYVQQAEAVLRERGIALPTAAPAAGHAGCPGMRMLHQPRSPRPAAPPAPGAPPESELRQWPVQLALVSPDAPYFKEADLLVCADCAPFTLADFHTRLLRGRTLVVFCPKLDSTLDEYVEKLAAIFKTQSIKSVTVAHMEVPCCSGVGRVVRDAQQRAGTSIPVTDITITLGGEVHE